MAGGGWGGGGGGSMQKVPPPPTPRPPASRGGRGKRARAVLLEQLDPVERQHMGVHVDDGHGSSESRRSSGAQRPISAAPTRSTTSCIENTVTLRSIRRGRPMRIVNG